MSHEFKIIETEHLTDKHIVIIEADTGNLPSHKAKEHLDNILTHFRNIIPEPTKIVVVPKGKIEVRIIEKDVD